MGMTKLHTISSARRTDLKCFRCGTAIRRGGPYMWWKFRLGGKNYRCMACPPKAWELESNAKRQALMKGVDAYDRCMNAYDPVTAASELRSAIEHVQDAHDEFESAVDSWTGTNLENSDMFQTFQDAVYTLSSWISDAEYVASDLEEWTPEQLEVEEDTFVDDEDDESWIELRDRVEDFPEVNF